MHGLKDVLGFISFILAVMAMGYRNRLICYLARVKDVAKITEKICLYSIIVTFLIVFSFIFFYIDEGFRNSCFMSYAIATMMYFLVAFICEIYMKKCVIKDA